MAVQLYHIAADRTKTVAGHCGIKRKFRPDFRRRGHESGADKVNLIEISAAISHVSNF